jgi:small-conductance mechanosensitive channel
MNKILAHIIIGLLTIILLPIQILTLLLYTMIYFIIFVLIYIIFKFMLFLCCVDTKFIDDFFKKIDEHIGDKLLFLCDIRFNLEWEWILRPEKYPEFDKICKDNDKQK